MYFDEGRLVVTSSKREGTAELAATVIVFQRQRPTVRINCSRFKQLNRRAAGGGVDVVDNGLRRGMGWSWSWGLFALRGRQVAGARGASGTTDLSGRTNLNDRFRSFNGRRAYRAEIGGAASIKVSSFESIESRNDCARRRSEILKQEHDRFSVAANERFLLARRVARCGRSRGRRPRALPYHCSGTRTRPMGKEARGTEVLAQTNVMFQRAE